MIEQMVGVLIDTHMGAVHALDDLAVNSPRHYLELAPDLLAFLRRTRHVGEFVVDHTVEVIQRFLCHIAGDIVDLAALRGNFHQGCHGVQLLRVLDGVALDFALGHGQQGSGDITPVIGVGSHTAGDRANHVTGADGAVGGAADAGFLFGVFADQPAGTHGAQLAA